MKKLLIFTAYLMLFFIVAPSAQAADPCDSNIIAVTVNITPNTLNLKSNGNWITCYIWLPADYNVADINPDSLLLNGILKAEWMWFEEEDSQQGLEQIAMAKFSRPAVQDMVNPGQAILTVTGEFTDEMLFSGSDTIRVIGTAPVFAIKTFRVKQGNTANSDSISISGTIDANLFDLASADKVIVDIYSASDNNTPIYTETVNFSAGVLKNNKFDYYKKKAPKKSLVSGIISLKIDVKTHKFLLDVKNIELAGLTYPVTLEIEMGNFIGSTQKN